MSSLFSASEISGILSVFTNSFDTWSRSVTIYKEPIKVESNPPVSSSNNAFGFGESQEVPIYTYLPARTGVFMAILKDSDIENTNYQANKAGLVPEITTRIIASPLSMKVKRDAYIFIEDGKTEKIIDNMGGETYLLDGHGCLQTYQGSEYYIYPLRKSH